VRDSVALEALDLQAIGPAIEGHELFPNRTNVSWYTESPGEQGRAAIHARIFERGVGETLSSGTGATGAAIAHILENSSQSAAGGGLTEVTVELALDKLEVEIGEGLQVHLTGWARPVFAGALSEDFERELDETE
jgi:diaminopimelate epimerase